MSDIDAKDYWEKKILGWEHARYAEQLRFYPPSWPIRRRLNAAIATIRDRFPAGGSVIELGCGSGFLPAALTRHVNAYQGIDIAEAAIAQARVRVPDARFQFRQGDALAQPLDGAGLTVFLGLTDWLTPPQMKELFARISSKYILFSYTDPSVLNPYRLYRMLMDKPVNEESYRGRTYAPSFIAELLADNGYRFEHITRPTLLNPGALVWASAVSHD